MPTNDPFLNDPTLSGPVTVAEGELGSPLSKGHLAAKGEAEFLSKSGAKEALAAIPDVKRAQYEIEYKSDVCQFGDVDPTFSLAEYMFSRAIDDGVYGAPGHHPANFGNRG